MNTPVSEIVKRLCDLGEAICQSIRNGEMSAAEQLFRARETCMEQLATASVSPTSPEGRELKAVLRQQRDAIRAVLQEREAFLLEQIHEITGQRRASQQYKALDEGVPSKQRLQQVTG